MKKSFLDKNYFKLQGKIEEIGDLVHITRDNLSDLFKKILVITTSDSQRLYPEIRNNNLNQLDNIKVNDIVDIEYTFEGSEKNGKRYNNIYINQITKV